MVYSRFVFLFTVLFLLLIVNLNKSLSLIHRMFQRQLSSFDLEGSCISQKSASFVQKTNDELWEQKRAKKSEFVHLVPFSFSSVAVRLVFSSPALHVFCVLGWRLIREARTEQLIFYLDNFWSFSHYFGRNKGCLLYFNTFWFLLR